MFMLPINTIGWLMVLYIYPISMRTIKFLDSPILRPFLQPHGAAINTECAQFFDSCEITSESNYDIKSCSLQIDPCRMEELRDIYVTLHSIPSPDYYWYQETLQYTITVERRNPTQDPYVLRKNGQVRLINF